MPDQITNSFVQNYQNKVYMALKEIGGKFAHTVEHQDIVGESSALVEVIGNTKAYRKTERHSTTPTPYDVSHDKRWVYPEYWRTNNALDTFDQVKMIIEVKNRYAELQANAIAVKQDTAIINALIGTAFTGKKGNIGVELPVEQKLFVDGTSGTVPGGAHGLSTYKLRKARQQFKKNNVDLTRQKLYIIVDPQQLDDMLGETVVGSIDYNSVKALIDGQVTKWMGFEFIEYNELPLDANGIRQCVTYTDKAVTFAKWMALVTHIDQRKGHDYDWQIYTAGIFGATRIDEKLVQTIGCKESTL